MVNLTASHENKKLHPLGAQKTRQGGLDMHLENTPKGYFFPDILRKISVLQDPLGVITAKFKSLLGDNLRYSIAHFNAVRLIYAESFSFL